MKISVPFGIAVLILASIAPSCASPARTSAQGGGVYLVGVAGGG